jgi:DNA uptake protein ComE-like DNA-binding protein
MTHRARRGIAVLIVLVVIAIGALAGTVALLAARGAGEAAAVSAGRLQSRLTMRSGVLVLERMATEQREAVLGGAAFEVESPIEIFADGSRASMFRLDSRLTAEPVSLDALLDVNTADAAMLARLPGMDETLAAAVAGALPVSSLRELLEVEGVTAVLLYGEYDEEGRLVSELPPLASLLTVGSADPVVTAGCAGMGEAAAGSGRVDVVAEGLANRQEALEALLPAEDAQQLVDICAKMDAPPTSRPALVGAMKQASVPSTSWGAWLDATTFGAKPVKGRIDINRAPVEVLAVIPGFGQDVAQKIVDARLNLAVDKLASVLWPLEEGLVDEEGMLEAVDRVTTRSVRWVLRAEAGMAAVRERAVGIDSLEDAQRARAGMAGEETDTLADRVAMDVLVDFSGARPVVVPLGEVSIAGELSAVARVLAAGERGDERFGLEPQAGVGP